MRVSLLPNRNLIWLGRSFKLLQRLGQSAQQLLQNIGAYDTPACTCVQNGKGALLIADLEDGHLNDFLRVRLPVQAMHVMTCWEAFCLHGLVFGCFGHWDTSMV